MWVDNVSTGQSQVLYKTDLTKSRYDPTENLKVGNYRVWIRAINANEIAGKWSEGYKFTVVALPAPEITAPGDTTDTTPRFDWTSVQGAAGYELFINNVETGETRIVDNIRSSEYTPTEHLPVGTYDVYVRAYNSAGEEGKWSEVHQFSVLRLPAPKLNGPNGSISQTRPTFSWETVQGASRYELWVDDMTAGTSQVIHKTDLPGNWNSYKDNNTELLFNHTYRFWMRSFNAVGEAGAWSDEMVFTIGG